MASRTAFPFGTMDGGNKRHGVVLPFHPRYKSIGDGLIVDFSKEIDTLDNTKMMVRLMRSRPAQSIIQGLIPEMPPVPGLEAIYRLSLLVDAIMERYAKGEFYNPRDDFKLDDIAQWLNNFAISLDMKVNQVIDDYRAYYFVKWVNDTHALVAVEKEKPKRS